LLDIHWLSDIIGGLIPGWGWFGLCAIAFAGRLLSFGGPLSGGPVTSNGVPTRQVPDRYRFGEEDSVIRKELSRLFTLEERHRRLAARLLLAFGVTMVVFAAGTVLMWTLESGRKGGDIHGLGDAAFFCAVQLLTVSSQIKNPLTSPGRIVDIGLQVWAIFVVTAVAGSFATFFSSGDSS
jgi:hypothetical protein